MLEKDLRDIHSAKFVNEVRLWSLTCFEEGASYSDSRSKRCYACAPTTSELGSFRFWFILHGKVDRICDKTLCVSHVVQFLSLRNIGAGGYRDSGFQDYA